MPVFILSDFIFVSHQCMMPFFFFLLIFGGLVTSYGLLFIQNFLF